MKTLLFLLGTFASSVLMFIYVKVTQPFFRLLDAADKWFMELLNFDGGTLADSIFYYVSSKTAWLPIGIAFVCALLLSRKHRRETVFIVIAIALTVTICDQVSSSLIKPAVARLRPSHCVAISDMLHFVNNYRSGSFGFCSSHAANASGVFVFISLLLRDRRVIIPLLVWTALVCYSRIYLGVHYPGDIICGCLIGVATGTFVYRLYISTRRMRKRYSLKQYRRRQALLAEAATQFNG